MLKTINKFFDKFEDKNRMGLSHTPILYGFFTGMGIILFWRGIWHLTDYILLYYFNLPIEGFWSSFISLAIGTFFLMAIGTFVSSFIGNEIIISGIKKEKTAVEKIVEAEEQDLEHEFEDDARIIRELREVKAQIVDLKKILEDKNKQ